MLRSQWGAPNAAVGPKRLTTTPMMGDGQPVLLVNAFHTKLGALEVTKRLNLVTYSFVALSVETPTSTPTVAKRPLTEMITGVSIRTQSKRTQG